jgi:hypothetical protein
MWNTPWDDVSLREWSLEGRELISPNHLKSHVFDIEPRSDEGFPFELINKRLFASVDCGQCHLSSLPTTKRLTESPFLSWLAGAPDGSKSER